MFKTIFKIALIAFLISWSRIDLTGATFTSEVAANDLTMSTTCWVAPSIPVLIYPLNNTYAGAGSVWASKHDLDWANSTTSCPLSTTITYQYQAAHDPGFSDIVYTSGWLSDSQIPAPGTPEGTYYWHVRSRDQFGNTSVFSDPWLLVVDRTAPVSTIDFPSPNSNVTGSPIHLAGTSHDDFGVTNVDLLYSLYVSGACQSSYTPITTLANSPVTNDFSWNYDWTPASADSYCIKAEATDRAGNKENSPIVANISYNIVSPSVGLAFSDINHIVISVTNITKFTSLTYQLTYETNSFPQGVIGKVDLSGGNSFEREILLGTCSTDNACVYHTGAKNFQLGVQLTDVNNNITNLSASL